MSAEDRLERAGKSYHRAVYNGDAGALAEAERDLDAVEADTALARGRNPARTVPERPCRRRHGRHLGIAAHTAGRLDEARERLEESSGLRREVGALPGVAANMVGLAYIAAAQGRRADADAILDEADAIAQSQGALAIVRQIGQARADFPGPT